MRTKTVNISLPDTLLDSADNQAELEHRDRSELFREALRLYLMERGLVAQNDSYLDKEIDRIKRILEFSNFQAHRILILSCVFRPQPNQIPSLFGGSTSEITKLIEEPPYFRYGGWDLQTLNRAKPVAGEYLQVNSGERKVIRVYRDGQIVFAGDEDLFGHGVNNNPSEDFAYNGLAVAELITNFTNFSHKVANFLDTPSSSMIFKIRVVNPYKERIRLVNVNRGNPFPEEVGEFYLDLADREILVEAKEFKLEAVAYKLLAEFLYFFGLSEDRFWYVNKELKEINLEWFREK